MKTIMRIAVWNCLLFANVISAESAHPDNNTAVDLFYSKQYDLALPRFEKYVSNATESQKNNATYQQALIYLSEILLIKNNTKNAVSYIEEALDIRPNSSQELLLAGDIYCKHARQVSIFKALGYGKKCIKYYEKAADQSPNNLKALSTVIQFHLYAPSFAGGSLDKGVMYLASLTEKSEEAARIHHIQLTEIQNDTSAALALAETFSEKTYLKTENQYQLAKFFKQHKYYIQAEKMFLEIIKKDISVNNTPSNWHVNASLLQLAEIYIERGIKADKSIVYIEQYLTTSSNPYDEHFYWSRWSLAKAYYLTGNLEQYHQMVESIKQLDYLENKEFKKHFERGVKERRHGGKV